MRKLGCLGALAAALLMSAGTAHADPFTVTSNTQSSTRGVDNAWFNNLIKLNGPPTATTKTYVANSIILFGGDLVVAPSAAITLISHGGVQAGFDGILSSGAVDTMSWASTNHSARKAADPKHAGSSSSVPGGNAAYDPLKTVYPVIGVVVPFAAAANGNAGVGLTLALLSVGIPGLAVDPGSSHADAVVAAALGMGAMGSGTLASVDPAGLPTTPEPSALFLLGGGLALALLTKRYNLGLNRG